MTQIDLNADLGEGFGPWQMGDDSALLAILSSANVACGFHAGDPAIMDRTVRDALASGVDVGAHVGFPDRQGFGRRVMQIEQQELTSIVAYQLGALAGIARRAGHRMTHMSFHGALGNMAAADAALADVLVGCVAEFDPGLTILSSTSRAIEGAAARHGLRVATCFLADRAYDDEGLLVPRKLPNSVIRGPAGLRDARDPAAAGRNGDDLLGQAPAHARRLHPAAQRHAWRGSARARNPGGGRAVRCANRPAVTPDIG